MTNARFVVFRSSRSGLKKTRPSNSQQSQRFIRQKKSRILLFLKLLVINRGYFLTRSCFTESYPPPLVNYKSRPVGRENFEVFSIVFLCFSCIWQSFWDQNQHKKYVARHCISYFRRLRRTNNSLFENIVIVNIPNYNYFRFANSITRIYHCNLFNFSFCKIEEIQGELKRSKMRSMIVQPAAGAEKFGYFRYLGRKLITIPPLVCYNLTIRGGIVIKNRPDMSTFIEKYETDPRAPLDPLKKRYNFFVTVSTGKPIPT